MLDTYIDEARFNQDLSNIETFGLDETSATKEHDYITLFVDLYKKAVVHISDGKSGKTVRDFVATLEQQNGNTEHKLKPLVVICPLLLLRVCERSCLMPKLPLTIPYSKDYQRWEGRLINGFNVAFLC